ncbi:SBBP repeat-containing protein [bacterium]|nr:SBBP repeat-containing protein [bacterium]MBU1880693.1 SBBP repeat-containing protein [bacterium]
MRLAIVILSIVTVLLSLISLPYSSHALEAVEVWTARYNNQGGSHDEPTCLALGEDGSVYVGGYSSHSTQGYDYLLIKYDNDGNELWVNRHNGPVSIDDWIHDLELDNDGNIIVTGSCGVALYWWDFVTIKYSPDGTELWTASYNGPGDLSDLYPSLAIDEEGNIFISGESYGDSTAGKDIATIKYDADGNELWVQRYDAGGMGDWSNDIAVDVDGNVFVTGTSAPVAGSYDITTIKYDTGGSEQWVAQYDGSMNDTDIGRALTVDGDGNTYVTGSILATGEYFDYVTIKYDNDGNEVWTRNYGDPFHSGDIPAAITVNDAGDVYVTGTNFNGHAQNYLTIKYSSDGFQQWTAQYDNNGSYGNDEVKDITLDSEGNIYITGWSDGYGTMKDYATVKYSPEGEEIWVARFDGALHYDTGIALVVDDDDYVYVTGHSITDSTWTDFLTVKYDQVIVGVESDSPAFLPELFQVNAYPNPFNPTTTITFDLPVASTITLNVYDINGRNVGTKHASHLHNVGFGESDLQFYTPGSHSITFDASGLASGVYLYRMEAGEFIGSGKMVLLK